MKVRKLLEALVGVDENLEVVVGGGHDHSYLLTGAASVKTVAKSREGYAEWAGEENASPGEKPVKALVIS